MFTFTLGVFTTADTLFRPESSTFVLHHLIATVSVCKKHIAALLVFVATFVLNVYAIWMNRFTRSQLDVIFVFYFAVEAKWPVHIRVTHSMRNVNRVHNLGATKLIAIRY